jgi:hypothetical protein
MTDGMTDGKMTKTTKASMTKASMTRVKTAFGPRRPLGLAVRLSALMATTYVLVATSEPYSRPVACLHLREQVTFDVAGTCGPPGTITVVTEEDECGIAVVNAGLVGLPAGGSFDVRTGENDTGLLRSAWTLSGFLTPAHDGGAAGNLADVVSSEVGPEADAGSETGGDGDGDGGAGDGGVSDAGGAPVVTVVPVPGSRAAGLGETRECKVTLGAKGPEALVCRPVGQNATSRADCTALLSQRL